MDEFKKIAPQMYKPVGQAEAEEVKEDEPQPSKLKAFFSQRAITDAEKEEHRKWEANRLKKSITNEIVEYYPRMMLFHTIVVAMCAIKAPTEVAVVLTWFTIILRLLMIFGWYCQKRACVYISAGVGEALINIILFGIAMAHSPY